LDIRNLVFVVLLIAIIVCGLLWRQLRQEKNTVPTTTVAQDPSSKKEDAEKAVGLAESLLGKAGVTNPLPIMQKDPFNSPIKASLTRQAEIKAEQQQIEAELGKIKLSSISYNKTFPLAVINGEIVEEGEEIKESPSFVVGKILPDSVELHHRNRNKYPISLKR
jgi:hypothetical protein